MFSKLRYIGLLGLFFSTLPSLAKGMESSIEVQQEPAMSLSAALEAGENVAIFNINDCFTDADSIQAFIESLLLGSKKPEQITQYFVTDDEANLDTVLTVVSAIEAKTCFVDERDAPIRKHYQEYASFNPEVCKYAYRVQDAAALLFPLAEKFGININVIQGEISTNPTYNPYFGNFGVGYQEQDLDYISRIYSKTGSKAVIAAMKQEVETGKRLYLLNGGSFRLLSDLQEMAPDLLPYIDVTIMGFRQPMNFPPFTNPGRRWSPSWNEGIDRNSTEKFMAFSSQSTNSQFGAFRIIDSNTVEYGMVCNSTMFPLYKDYMTKLKPVISEVAYQNLLDAEERHEIWSWFKTKFMDPIIVFDAFSLVSIPRIHGKLLESTEDFCIRPAAQGFPAYYPHSEGQHPFSCPRANTPEEEEQHSDYGDQYKRVGSFRMQLKNAHQKTWDLLD